MTPPKPRRFRWPRRNSAQVNDELDTELQFHLDMRAAELVSAGMSEEEAAREARREFGDIEFTRRYCRTMDERAERGRRWSERVADARQSIARAVRSLRRSPGFAAVSLLTLALAIGANTAIFSVTNAIFLAPPPFGDPGRLVVLYENKVKTGVAQSDMSAADLVDYRASQASLTGLAAFAGGEYFLRSGSDDPIGVRGFRVTADMFDVLEARPLLGRTFAPGEDTPGNTLVLVLSYNLWQTAFGADSGVVDHQVNLNNQPYTIVGVMPRGFTIGGREDVWVPLDLSTATADPVRARRMHFAFGIGRLAPGVNLETAQTDLLGVARRLEASYPDVNDGHLVTLMPVQDALVGADVRRTTLMLTAAAALVLVIACANLTNVTLSRAVARRGEMALRAAIGAGRGHLVRQLLTESVVLAVIGGAAGVGLAHAGTRFLLAMNPATLTVPVRTDTRVLLFSLVLSVITGVLFGLIPALSGSRLDLHYALRQLGRGQAGGGEALRRGMVVTQVALAVVLLVTAGLFVRSLSALRQVPMGFNPEGVLTAGVPLRGPRYSTLEGMNQFYDGVFERMGNAPGVVAIGAVSNLPLVGSSGCGFDRERDPFPADRRPEVRCLSTRGEYFQAMGTPLKRGRFFDATDRPDGPMVVVINASLAQLYWPGGNPLGERIRLGPDPSAPWQTIVGVVGDIRQVGLDLAPRPTAFELDTQHGWGGLMLAMRTTGDPFQSVSTLRAAVRESDPNIPLRNVRTMDDILGLSLAGRTFSLALIGSFAVLALLLAALGVYGVVGYAVTSRTREFGIRMALGASGRSVMTGVLRQGIGWSVVGLVLGVAGASAAGRWLGDMLFEVPAADAVSFGIAGLTLLGAVVAASLIPALRATRVDPNAALRQE